MEIRSDRIGVGGWRVDGVCVAADLRVQCTCVRMCQRVCVRELAARFVRECTRSCSTDLAGCCIRRLSVGPFLPPPMLCRHGFIPARQAHRHSGDAPVGQATRMHRSTHTTGAEASGGRESQEWIADCPTRLTVFFDRRGGPINGRLSRCLQAAPSVLDCRCLRVVVGRIYSNCLVHENSAAPRFLAGELRQDLRAVSMTAGRDRLSGRAVCFLCTHRWGLIRLRLSTCLACPSRAASPGGELRAQAGASTESRAAALSARAPDHPDCRSRRTSLRAPLRSIIEQPRPRSTVWPAAGLLHHKER